MDAINIRPVARQGHRICVCIPASRRVVIPSDFEERPRDLAASHERGAARFPRLITGDRDSAVNEKEREREKERGQQTGTQLFHKKEADFEFLWSVFTQYYIREK